MGGCKWKDPNLKIVAGMLWNFVVFLPNSQLWGLIELFIKYIPNWGYWESTGNWGPK